MLPLVQRELTRAGRRKGLYAARVLVPAAACVVLVFLSSLFRTSDMMAIGFNSEAFSSALMSAAYMFQLAIVVIMAPILSAGVIAQEKHDRTLSLLLLADMRGADIILSKWISVTVQVLLYLFSTLPVLAIAAFFGGVAVPAIALQVLYMSMGAATVAAIGILMSTTCTRIGEAIIGTVLAMGLFSFVLNLLASVPASGYAFDIFRAAYIAENMSMLGPLEWMLPMLPALLVASAALAAAIAILPSRIFDTPTAKRPSRSIAKALTSPIRFPRLKRNSKDDPAVAMVRHCSTGLASRAHSGGVLLLSILLAAASFFICPVAAPLIVALIAYDIASSSKLLRESGVLDDLTLTAMHNTELARVIERGHQKRSRFYFPALFVTSLYGGLIFRMIVLQGLPSDPLNDPTSLSAVVAFSIAGILFLIYAYSIFRMVTMMSCAVATQRISVPLQVTVVLLSYLGIRAVALVFTFGGLVAGPFQTSRMSLIETAFIVGIAITVNIAGPWIVTMITGLQHRAYFDRGAP